ncbi:Trp biosynthesis-associated membrane protein [Streptomyces griseocarneus]|uniref:Trp biosynthesis-associated membrane protein n=1 Tax=Streptomyces griseocarneus TaxID=51201 RepID=UPI001F6143C1|nr:Trp biosynthesis-associated membrane protein [Streptomyces griseocarneus]
MLAVRYGRRWPTMSGRYERDGTPARAVRAPPSTPTAPRSCGRPSTAARTPPAKPAAEGGGVTRQPRRTAARGVGDNVPERSLRPRARYSNEESTHVG